MKKIITIVILFIGMSVFSQNKNAKSTIEVDGICLMCKERIEKACFKTKGVKSAVWDVYTHELKLIFNEKKTNLTLIKESIAKAGHDTVEIKATDENYNALHGCCKYRDEEVIESH